MNKICFIAQFPPPMHGLSKAVETLYNSNKVNKVYELEKIDITNNKKFFVTLVKIIISNADLFYFTISQTKGGNLRDLIILKLLEMKQKKVLIHLHGGYYRNLIDKNLSEWQRKANYKAISKIDGAIVLGPSLRWIFKDMLPENKIFTVPNCVDNEYLLSDRHFIEKKKDIKNRKVKHVLYLSNFIKSKGYDIVLEMAKIEKYRAENGGIKEYHFDFAGKFFDNNEKNYFFDYIRNNDLDAFISYHGVVSGNEKNDLLARCDFFALPTYYPNEGQPISILEAMGNGMVVLTTNHAGIPDIVQDGENGIVLDISRKNISEVFYDRLIKLDYKDYLRIINNNRFQIQSSYNEKNYISNIINVFNSTLSQQ